jgi:tRNA pseudouridine38-40 synthase
MRYFCRVSYDGTGYGGWQRQPNAVSIQQVLEEKAAILLKTPVSFTGAGRTDAGVHAKALGAHFNYEGPIDLFRFTGSINALMPQDIAVYGLRQVDDSFHARYSAVSRSYRYTICTRKSPLLVNRAWTVVFDVDWGMLKTQIPSLLGEHDFTSFCASGSGSATAVCNVYSAAIEQADECMVFSIEANRFVYKMVRSIVGTLVDIGRGRQNLTLKEILGRKERELAGSTAPACGLLLNDVVYEGLDPAVVTFRKPPGKK